SYAFVEDRGIILRNDAGQPIRMLGAMQDVTGRKQSELALRESDTRLNAILESATDGILAIDHNGKVIQTNQRFSDMWGIPKLLLETQDDQALLGFVMSQLNDPDDFVNKVYALYSSDTVDMDILSFKDGRIFERHSSPLILNDIMLGRVWTFRDITERKLAEANRLSLEAQLRESQKMQAIGTLAGGIAHDFNNILATILGNTELARQDIGANPPAIDSINEIRKAATRARDLVQQILSFSRRQPTDKKLIALLPVIVESARLLRAALPARIELKLDCEPDGPLVLADATQIEQVIINLCTNAMQAIHGQPGKITLRLDTIALDGAAVAAHPGNPSLHRLHQQHPGRTVRLAINDNGSGIDAAIVGRIFEPFFTTKAVNEGTGLGLSVVHGIIEAHEGAITVDSRLGEGATFTLYLPIAEASALALTPPAPSRVGPNTATLPASTTPTIPSTTAPALHLNAGLHILYLDDDESMVNLVERLLERRGYRVSGYIDQKEALSALRADPTVFDMVVTDYNMPGMSGLDVARAIQTIRADLPVAIASGFIDEALRAEAAAVGVCGLIFKATSPEEFCEVLLRLM
ncbi:MAG: ATP-binding protein, partial [Pseudomonadota bacterium]